MSQNINWPEISPSLCERVTQRGVRQKQKTNKPKKNQQIFIHLASQDLDTHTFTQIHGHTWAWAEFHAYRAVIVCPNPSIRDYYSLIRLISYLRNCLYGQPAKRLHTCVCVFVSFSILGPVFMQCIFYMCVCVSGSLCAYHCGDISIGRSILLSLRVDFKGEEISAGFSRLVNSLSPESGVFSTGICGCVCICVCACVCLYVRVYLCVYVYVHLSSYAYMTAKALTYGC